ncbi:hypothetical protein JQ612_26800 [Bradyrhizobium manausense]|uniref:AraC family transcriptional regulator n=1 Tax=Bradyrhizobium manausense TaxID=989370 RepID=UPI001BACE8B8|nr:AraC family transcriptional regulator [Bradyrhizobium manausense]MBR0836817.1 hypothetical protein [Bradyrhizobium manausense]
MSVSAYIDEVRRQKGLLTPAELIDLSGRGNLFYDPYSVLISARAVIGRDNVFFPGVYLFCTDGGALEVQNGNTFHANTLIEASNGRIRIGSHNQFGEGGFTAKANRPGASISIGDEGRYLNGASVFGETDLGSGSQLLGQITVDTCTLSAGGSFREADPDRRAGLLKGTGVARNLTVPVGQVAVGAGSFSASDLQPQSNFHPKA